MDDVFRYACSFFLGSLPPFQPTPKDPRRVAVCRMHLSEVSAAFASSLPFPTMEGERI